MTIQFAQRHFVEEYDPTIEDNYRVSVTLDNRSVILDILDTAGQEEYSAMRDQYMRSGDGFLLCYSVTSRSSFMDLKGIYEKILQVKDVDWFPVVLVATKADLGSIAGYRAVGVAEGIDMARYHLGNCTFVETSALVRVNVEEAFSALARLVWDVAMNGAQGVSSGSGGVGGVGGSGATGVGALGVEGMGKGTGSRKSRTYSSSSSDAISTKSGKSWRRIRDRPCRIM